MKNTIVFFTDQQRGDTLGANGNPSGLTPNLDYYADQGINFQNAFTPQPVCGPARSVMQTGKFATKTGCFRNKIPLDPSEWTIAKALGSNKIQTAYFGKWHLGNPNSFGKVSKKERGGYEFWLAANLLEFVSNSYDARLYDSNDQEVRLPGYRVDAVVDAAIRYIFENQNKSFFIFISLLEPHHQNHLDNYPAPHGYEDRYRDSWIPLDLQALGGSTYMHLPGYYGMIKRIDEAYGRLIDSLISLNLFESTNVVFTSDHGNQFKTRNDEYKRTPHDSAIHIPLVCTGGDFLLARTVRQIVSLIDIVPTILDLHKLSIPEDLHGKSLLPLCYEAHPAWNNSALVQISETQIGRAIRTKKWVYSVIGIGDPWNDSAASLYTGAYLYDLQTDSAQLHNLINYRSHIPVQQELKLLLTDLMYQADESDFEITVLDSDQEYNQLKADNNFPYFPEYLIDFR
jgi:arylsulfatase A-like enzyme